LGLVWIWDWQSTKLNFNSNYTLQLSNDALLQQNTKAGVVFMIDNSCFIYSFRLSSAFRMKLIYFDQFYFKNKYRTTRNTTVITIATNEQELKEYFLRFKIRNSFSPTADHLL
jgi:hypothetical protein